MAASKKAIQLITQLNAIWEKCQRLIKPSMEQLSSIWKEDDIIAAELNLAIQAFNEEEKKTFNDNEYEKKIKETKFYLQLQRDNINSEDLSKEQFEGATFVETKEKFLSDQTLSDLTMTDQKENPIGESTVKPPLIQESKFFSNLKLPVYEKSKPLGEVNTFKQKNNPFEVSTFPKLEPKAPVIGMT